MAGKSNPKVLFSTSLGSFLSPFTSSIISFSVPEIGNDLGVSFTLMVWVPLAFLIALPSLMVLFGKLSDSFGRARFYMIGFVIFGAGAVLAGVSYQVYQLIFSTLVMGIGASLLSVNGTAIVSSVYSSESRGGALGINAMSVYLGLTSGPVLAGAIIGALGWHSLFLLVSVFAFMSIIPAFSFLRRAEIPTRARPIDVVGFFVFLAAILSVVLYLSFSEVYGWFSTIYLLASGIALLAIFVLYERNKADPILDIRLFTRNRTFSAANFTAFLNYISTFAIIFVFSVYFSVIAGISPEDSGLILTVEPVLMVIFSPLSGRLSDRFGSRGLASLGMLIISIAFFFLYFAVGKISPVEIAWPLGAVGVGFGLFSAPNTNSVMSSVDRKDSGTASGTLGTMRFLGQLMSLAVMSTLLAESMPRNMILELFSGASSGSAVLDAVAFLSGLKTVMLVSGILSLAGVFTSLVRGK